MIAKVIFVISLCTLAFFYGVGAMRFKLFPYQTILEATSALEAWWDVYKADQINLLFVDKNGAPKPQVTWFENSHDDGAFILMSGGPGALTSLCPQFGCMAWIMNRQGEVLHHWEVDQGALWADSPHVGLNDHDQIAPIGLHLSDQGDLIVSFGSQSLFPYGIGMAKFDKHGNVIWKKANFSHHWFSVAPSGLIYTPAHRLAESPLWLGGTKGVLKCDQRQIYSDVILVLNAQGETIEEISILDRLVNDGFVGLFFNVRPQCDPIHLNYVEYVTKELAQAVTGLNAGDLIISARNLNLIAAIDGTTRKLKWVLPGRTVNQHSPRLLPDGSILVFDNYGGRRNLGGSRVVRLHYGRNDLETVFPGPDAADGINFFTSGAGHIDPHPDGVRGLVSLTEQGRVLEIDLRRGRVLWELVNTHDLGPYVRRSGRKQGGIGRLWANGAWYVGRPAFLSH